jgi:lipopolysaccharide/colanic/teichoic acid biosynthesis glycosyltransferase/glycosyltransferase involved in cell wall biosynthesis
MSLRYLLLNQLRSIQQAGYEVVGISTPGPDVAELEAAGIRHMGVSMTRNFTPFADLLALLRLYRVIRREKFTIVHTHTPKPGLLGQLAARMAGVPVVINTLHGFYFHDNMAPFWRRVYITTEKIAARCSDIILSQNSEDVATAVREGICPPTRIKHLGNGVDVERFDPGKIDRGAREEKRAELGIPAGAPVVGFVGRLVAEKGIFELLKAAQIVVTRVPGVRFLIIGPTDSEKSDALTEDVAHQLGVGDVCVFTGMRSDMPELYACMDAFVLPSHREGFPRSPMEASAMAVPCIVTDIRGCRETVERGRNGTLVPLGSVVELADAIVDLLIDPQKARDMGIEGRRMALERFDERLVFERVKAEYASLLESKVQTKSKVQSPKSKARQQTLDFGLWTLDLERSDLYKRYGKRLLDIAIAGLIVAISSPLMAAVAALVRLKLGSPVLFRQQRPGLHGRPFTLLKFRTMSEARDERGILLPDARRITPLGRLLRLTSLDELPELLNVLKGDMSLVGPRPLLMEYLDRYTPEQMRRHDVRPGITGWAQVNGRNALTWERKFELDLWYIEHRSLRLDLKILVLTLWKVLSSEGISQEGHATMSEFLGVRNEDDRSGIPHSEFRIPH